MARVVVGRAPFLLHQLEDDTHHGSFVKFGITSHAAPFVETTDLAGSTEVLRQDPVLRRVLNFDKFFENSGIGGDAATFYRTG